MASSGRAHLALILLALLASCTRAPDAPAAPPAPTEPAPKAAEPAPLAAKPAGPGTLLLAQAQFTYATDPQGKRTPQPGPAKLTLLTHEGAAWKQQVIEDPDSRVFHKAFCKDLGQGPALLTFGGSGAILRSWSVANGAWQASAPIYKGTFGGKWDRLRDAEVQDLDGDGKPELVVGTHDQGVILVFQGANPKIVFERPNTFIHEIELGDVMGLGRPQIFATPSDPNKANASQAGGILALVPTGKGDLAFKPSYVADLKNRHAKEILVSDLDADGTPELYAALEAEVSAGTQAEPVEVRRYRYVKRAWQGETLAKLDRAVQSRVLLAADLTGRGKDLIVTTMKDGVWRLVRDPKGKFTPEQIDGTVTGFELAANALDTDGDGKLELFVAADDQDELIRYTWSGTSFTREVIATLEKSDITWNIEACQP